MSIRLRIILLVIVPVLLCSVISGALSSSASMDGAVGSIVDRSESVNSSCALVLSSALGKYTAQVEALAREADFFESGATDEDKLAVLQRHASGSDIKNVGIFGQDGKNLFIGYADGRTLPVGVADVSARSYLRDALGGKTVVFGPSKDVVTGDITITIATPTNVPGAPKSIVAIDFDISFLDDIVDRTAFGKTGVNYLVDSAGMVIASPDDSLIGLVPSEISAANSDYRGFAEAVSGMLAGGGSGSFHFDHNGENYATYRQVEGTDDWKVISASMTSEYMTEYYRSIYMQLIVLISFLLAAIGFALLIGKTMSTPIRYASELVLALSRGELTPVDLTRGGKRKDEIGTLIRSLDQAVNQLNDYIGDISAKLQEMSTGNLRVAMTREYQGDFAPIQTSLTTIIDFLNNVIHDLQSSSSQVASGSAQIAMGAQTLATGSTQQSATVQELSATVAEIQNQAQNNTELAGATLEELNEAGRLMKESMDSMEELTGAMETINASSKEISKVIKVIDDIAFQTNILALNAAVEAARAGQHGKGFAVVADEVRNLASKSADAAKETSALIQNSVSSVTHGAEIAEKTSEGLGKVGAIAVSNAEAMGRINEASAAQSRAITEVMAAIDQISNVVQSNSATSEESAASAEELSAQSALLNEIAAGFKVRDRSEQSRIAHYPKQPGNSAPIPRDAMYL